MRTIAFFSYKGGNGKSLIAANLAVCLSRLGKSSVLVDWDVDAPSAQNKLFIGDVALGRPGLIGLMLHSVEIRGGAQPRNGKLSDSWENARMGDIARFNIPDDLSRYTYEMRDIREREAVLKDPHYGRIHLLPAGDVYADEYWNTTWSPLWRDIFTIGHGVGQGASTPEQLSAVIHFLQGIKNGLGKLAGSPEYLLIDCRSGSSDLTSTVMSAWLDPSVKGEDSQPRDHLVYCLTFNQDSINYLDRFAAKLDPQYRHAIMPVLCRVPKGFGHHLGDRGLRLALSKLQKDPEKDLLLLHSDRVLEGEERLRLGIDSPPEYRMLTTEYLKLFERLLPEELWKGYSSLAQAIGLPNDIIEEKERLFSLDMNSGALVNPNDDTRNVSFKVETFQLLLSGLESGLAATVGANDPKSVKRVFFAAGTQCGRRFGAALAKIGMPRGESGGPHGKIQVWCRFDSDVGFGRFELLEDDIETRGQRLLRCSIVLHESFLALPTQANVEQHKYCAFMKGYVKGVLEELLNVAKDTLVVDHAVEPKKDEGQLAGSCRFEVWDKAHMASVGHQVTDEEE